MRIPPLEFDLPESDRLNPALLVKTFDDNRVTNSYKHLLFRVLLHDGVESGRRELDFRSLAIGMMEEAWWPGIHHGLNFGPNDKTIDLMAVVDLEIFRRDPGQIGRKLTPIVEISGPKSILRHVPYRFLSPWFDPEAGKFPDSEINRRIERLSVDRFSLSNPIYKIIGDKIEIHPDWVEYLDRNLEFYKGVSDALWLRYLKNRNPEVVDVSEKIAPGLSRNSLGAERALWNTMIKEHGVLSVYSGELIGKDDFELDHFLPRPFVAHDRFWNLTPVERSLSAVKRDHLPDLAFIPHLARQHSLAARKSSALRGGAKIAWNRAVAQYATELELNEEQIRDEKMLERVYREIFPGRVGIAKRMGFSEGWRPETRDIHRPG